jgi:bacterioferritin
VKNTTQSIENLQEALGLEMTTVQQYMLHAHVLDDWGLDVLARKMRQEMNEELVHAGRFIDRILFLGGHPAVKSDKIPKRATSLQDMFRADLDEERGAIAYYTAAARAANEDRDIGTRMLFEAVLLEEESHREWLTQQVWLLERMGEPIYTARSMSHALGNR